MSRLQDQLQQRAAERETTQRGYEQAQEKIQERYEARLHSLQSLLNNKDFKEYLKIEQEMNDPMIVIAQDCTDPACMAMKRKIREFGKMQRLLEKVKTNGTRPRAQSRPRGG